jgi:hypothetical protein
MNRRNALLAAAMTLGAASIARADYSVWHTGEWPKTWPKELEALRKQSSTYEGPKVLFRTYLIPFTKREEFEDAWRHLLKVKTKGAPIILVHGPRADFFPIKPAGVLIHTPPIDSEVREAPRETTVVRDRWLYANYIELAVDGEIVDLNRIELPEDTPIIDERFKDSAKK